MKLTNYFVILFFSIGLSSCSLEYLIYKSSESCHLQYDMFYNTLDKRIHGTYNMTITRDVINKIVNINNVKQFITKNDNEFYIIFDDINVEFDKIKNISEQCVKIMTESLKEQCIRP